MAVPEWLAVATWLIYPFVFVAGCWGVVWYPNVVVKVLPWPLFEEEEEEREGVFPSAADGIFYTLLGRQKIPLSEKELKAVPKNRLSAFFVGRVVGKIEAPDSSENMILVEAADILGIPVEDLNKETLINLGDIIEVVERRETKLQIGKWLLHFFSIVNVCWLIGIIGLMCTIVPFLNAVGGPFMHWLGSVALSLYHLLSLLEPLWLLVFWLICVYLAAVSLSVPPHVAPWVVLTANFISVGCYSYGTDSLPSSSIDWQQGLCSLYLSLAIVPMALKFDSGLLGFASVFTTWATIQLGFNFFEHIILEKYLDFNIICLSSFVITILLVILKFRLEDRMFGPFRVGLYFFGPLLFLGVFLFISAFWVDHTTLGSYVTANVLYIASILTMFAYGTVVDFKSFRQTSILFSIFWVFARILDATLLLGDKHLDIEIFLVFLAIVFSCAYIQSHRDWSKNLVP